MSTPTYSYGYLKPPPAVAKLQALYDSLNADPSLCPPGKVLRPFADIVYEKFKKTMKNGRQKGLKQITTLNEEGMPELRWAMIEDFNPSSSTQLLKYLKWKIKTLRESADPADRKLALSYYIPVKPNGKPTTSSKELRELIDKTGDPLLEATLEYRSICTNLNNYYPNWEPWPDGRVHPEFQNKPPGGQINSINPNVQNLSKHTPVGQRFRRMVEAGPGRYILSFDKSRFHVVMMGWVAGCPDYIKFGQLDCHSIFTSWICGSRDLEIDLNESETDIRAKVKVIKERFGEIRDTLAKPTVLGNQLGLGARKMFYMNRKAMKTIARADELQGRLRERFKKVEKFKTYITQHVADQSYYVTTFGWIRHFFDVLTPKWNPRMNRWEQRHGRDYERVIALPVQSNAFGMIREEWHIMEQEYEALSRFDFFNTVHDSNEFNPYEDDVEACIKQVYDVMTRPCEVLTNPITPAGLIVGTGVSVGRNMQTFYDKHDGKKPYNPQGLREIKVYRDTAGDIQIGEDWKCV